MKSDWNNPIFWQRADHVDFEPLEEPGDLLVDGTLQEGFDASKIVKVEDRGEGYEITVQVHVQTGIQNKAFKFDFEIDSFRAVEGDEFDLYMATDREIKKDFLIRDQEIFTSYRFPISKFC